MIESDRSQSNHSLYNFSRVMKTELSKTVRELTTGGELEGGNSSDYNERKAVFNLMEKLRKKNIQAKYKF